MPVKEQVIATEVDATESRMTCRPCAGPIEAVSGIVGRVGERTCSAKTRQLRFKLVELLVGRGAEAMGAWLLKLDIELE